MARIELGVTDEQFWKLTHRQLDALMRRHRERLRRDEIPHMVIARLLAAGLRIQQNGRPVDVAKFFPIHAAEAREPRASSAATTWQTQLANVVMWNRLFGGRDLRPGAHAADQDEPIPPERLSSV